MAQRTEPNLLPGKGLPGTPIVAAARGEPAAPARPHREPQILRFRKTERQVHWTIAIPFLTCLTTAGVMVMLQGRVDHPLFRTVISWTHRISGLCLIALPFAAVFRSKGDLRIHVYNIRQAWIWTLSDVKWLIVVSAAAISKKVALPEQGKFNAAEKLNFMVLMGTYPFYIATGLTIWLTHNAFLSWVVHVSIAIVGLPLVLGHIYMATINPSSRVGLQGMITGFVDRHWARHHYRRWYEEHFEVPEAVDEATPGVASVTPAAWRHHGTHVFCAACGGDFAVPKLPTAAAAPGSGSLTCPHCGAGIRRLDPAPAPGRVDAALSGISAHGGATGMLSEALHRCEDSALAASAPASSSPSFGASYIGFSEPGDGQRSPVGPGKETGSDPADAPA